IRGLVPSSDPEATRTMTRTPRSVTVTPVPASAAGRGADPLAIVPQVLDLVRLHGAIFLRATFHAPWQYQAPRFAETTGILPAGPGSVVVFHIITEGDGW